MARAGSTTARAIASPDKRRSDTCFVTLAGSSREPAVLQRPVGLPVLARLVLPGKTTIPARARKTEEDRSGARHAGRPAAASLVTRLAAAFPGREAVARSWPT